MELTRLAPMLVERLLVLEERAAHAHAVAAVAEHMAWRARQELGEDLPRAAARGHPAGAARAQAGFRGASGTPRRAPAPARSEGNHPMSRPDFPRPYELRNAASQPGDDADNYFGAWSRARLKAMDRRFAAAMMRAEPAVPRFKTGI